MFVDHFPAPFARSFDLVFRTVLAKLLSLKNLSKVSISGKNICILCLKLTLAIFYLKIQMEHFCVFSNTVYYLLRRRLLRRNAFCLGVLVPPPPVL